MDDSFVGDATHREPSHRDRLLEVELRQSDERGRHHREALEAAYRAELTHQPDADFGDDNRGRSSRDRRRRVRQVVGVVITVAVVATAYGSEYLPFARPSRVALVPTPVADCASNPYPIGSQYRFEQCWDGAPVAWSHCSTLTAAVDPANAPSSWRADVGNALAQLSAATGLKFRTVARGSGDISIGWDSNLLASPGWQHDKAGVTHLQSRTNNLTAEIATARIQISSRLAGGTGRSAEVPVLLHELGHAVGLGHYQGSVVMNPLDQGYSTYQGGDLQGLAALYQPSTCN